MRFLVDAQLPRRLAAWLASEGHDALHTTELPSGNRTTDDEITHPADADDRVVVTKDADFVDSHVLRGRPRRLLLIATGNISNSALANLLVPALPVIVSPFEQADFIELSRTSIITHA